MLNGKLAEGKARTRAIKVLDQVRALGKMALKARVESTNNFPTASGLASSASGFAALVAAAWTAAGVAPGQRALERMSRRRQRPGGAQHLRRLSWSCPAANPATPACAATADRAPGHWDVRIVVAVANEGPKRWAPPRA